MPTQEQNHKVTIPAGYTCFQESRLSAIETKLENKKETIHELNDDYYHLRDKLDLIAINVAELTAIVKTIQENNKKVEELQKEITALKSNWENLKWIIGIGVPILTTILSVVANIIL